MLASHKLVRWLAPWGLALAALGWLLLAATYRSWVMGGIFALPLLLAVGGWLWPEGRHVPRIISLPAYVVSGIVAAMDAWLRALRGELNPVWEPTRRQVAGPQ